MSTSRAWKQKAIEEFKSTDYFRYDDTFKVWKVGHLIFARSFVTNGNKQRTYIGMTMFWNTINNKIDFVND